jgi:hypothetical protein
LLNAVDSYREREVDANIVTSHRLLTKGFYSFRIGTDQLFLSVIA